MDFSDFHFLRPAWLLLALLGAVLPLVWRRSRDLQQHLRGNIAAHLLPHLLLTPSDPNRVRPVHLMTALLVIGALAAAGPTWQQDRPDFLENRAPLIIAVDLSPSMDTADVPPTRLKATQQKLHDLIQRRQGARTALLVYTGNAHLVLPPTDDPALLDTFIQALGTDLLAKPGKDVAAVIDQAKGLLQDTPGTLLLITDGADVSQVRESAVRAVSALLPPPERVALYAPLLKDPVRAVRILAAQDLLGVPGQGPAWDSAIAEYEQVQLSLQERAEANLNLAMLYQASGRGAKVEAQLRTALLRDPDFFPALVTLAQWLEANDRAQEARSLIAAQLARRPDAALLQHTQGLMLIRGGDSSGAMAYLRSAARLEPASGQYRFVLAVALHDSGKVDEACQQLESLLKQQPYNRNARLSLIQYYLENGQEPKAQAIMQGWKQLNPGDPALK